MIFNQKIIVMNLKYILASAIFFCAFSLMAQNERPANRSLKLGLEIVPGLPYITMSKSTKGGEIENGYSISYGANSELGITSNFAIKTGIAIAERKFKYSGTGSNGGGLIFESDLINHHSPGSSIYANGSIRSLEIPVLAKYYFSGQRLFFSIGGIFSRTLNTESGAEVIYGTGGSEKFNNIPFEVENTNYFGVLSFGYSQKIGKKIFILFEPALNYTFKKNGLFLYKNDKNNFGTGLSISVLYQVR